MKTLKIPFVGNLPENASLKQIDEMLELNGARAFISEVNWPDAFPYAPLACATVGRTARELVVRYNVRGLDLRATSLGDDENQWEDSCCEIFTAHPTDGTYYNFEMNCIGTLLAAKRRSREDFVWLDKEQMARIGRYSSLEIKRYEMSGEMVEWCTAIVIPMDIIGLDPENLPTSIRANFFKCGDRTAHVHFLSWNPISTSQPDFHRPECFGELFF